MRSMPRLEVDQPILPESPSQKVRLIGGCIFVDKASTSEELESIRLSMGGGARVDVIAAARYGVEAVIGQRCDIERLRYLPLPHSFKQIGDIRSAKEAGLTRLSQWLKDGDRCEHSDFFAKGFFPMLGATSYRADIPFDVESLRRVLALLVITDTETRLNELLGFHQIPDNLIVNWSDLVRVYRSEVKGLMDTEAPKTALLLQQLTRV